MEKINSLTPQQEKDLVSFREEMLKIGRSIEPINRAKAEGAIAALYKSTKRKTPNFLYFPSPLSIINFKKECGDDSGVSNYFAGQQWIYWKAYYKFSQKIGVKFTDVEAKLLDESMEESIHLHWWFPYEDYVLVCERPIRLTVNETGALHNEKTMAIEYADGWGLYYLNGVCVPKELVVTDSEALSLDFFKKEKNADVKSEFVRKYGVERMLDFGKMVDTYKNYDQEENPLWWSSEYELWDMSALFDGIPFQPYLKMLNQTTDIWHVEAVSPVCNTLKKAIVERFGGRDMKIVAIA